MTGRSQQQFPTDRRGHSSPEGGREVRQAEPEAFSFGPFRAIPHARLLERHGSPVRLGSRAFDLLCLLVRRPGEVVSKTELLANTWPNTTVEECSLRFHIARLRRALGEGQEERQYVITVPGRGYCFVVSVDRSG